MTPEKLKQLAKEAELPVFCGDSKRLLFNRITGDELLKFAELVAAHERERCAKVCDAEAQADIEDVKIAWQFMGNHGGASFPHSDDEILAFSKSAKCAAAIRALNNEDAK